jgi:hypothetical protein
MQPLSLKLNDVDTSMPLLVEGKYALRIDKAEVVVSKSGKGSFLEVTYKTQEDAMSNKGSTINAGFPMIQRYMLPIPGTEFGESKQTKSYYQGLCRFILACANLKDTKKNKTSLPEFNEDYVANLSGIVVSGYVKTSKPKDDGDDFGPRSEVRSVSGIDPQ